ASLLHSFYPLPTLPPHFYPLSLHDALPIYLGYFVVRAFQWIIEIGAFFVSRCRTDVNLYEARTGKALNLAAELRRRGSFDSAVLDRKSTRLNSSHLVISYAVSCLKKQQQRA